MTLVHNQLKLLTIYCSHVPMKWCIFLYVEWFASKIFRTIQSWEDLAECTDFVENCYNLNLKCFAAKVISIRCVEEEYTQIYWCTHAWTKQVIKVFCFCLFVCFFLRGLKHWISRKEFLLGVFFFFFFFLIWPVKGSNLMWNHMKSLFRGCFGESQNYFNPCSHICKSINLSASPPH